jgi:hypothetical protein
MTALVAGTVLRFVVTSALWLDEAQSVAIARLPPAAMIRALRQDGSPPLYYEALHVWMGLFGRSDVAVRALSGVVSVITVAVVWPVARRLGGSRAAVAAVLLVAANPFTLRYATETRMYALIMLEVALGALALQRAEEAPTAGRLLTVAVMAAALPWTHYWGLYLVVATGAVLAWVAWRTPARRPTMLRLLGAVAAGLATWVLWLPSFLYQARHTGTPWAGRPTPWAAGNILPEFAGGFSDEARLLTIVLGLLILLGLMGRALDRHRVELDFRVRSAARPVGAVAALTVVLALTAGLLSGSAFVARYTAVVLVPVLLLAALGAATLASRAVRAGVLAVAVALGLWLGVNSATTPRTEAPLLARALLRQVEPGDVVVYCPDQLGPALSRLLPASITQLTYPRLATPQRVDWVDYQETVEATSPTAVAAEVERRAGDGVVWLVSDLSYNGLQSACSSFQTALLARRPYWTTVIHDNPGQYFEHAQLLRLPAGP